MNTARWLAWNGSRSRSGVTLLEVLVAILITGIGLLALLVLFPLGTLQMARAVQDDRAAAVARDAVGLSRAGLELLSETGTFLAESLSNASADPQAAANLRAGFEELNQQAADLEARLAQLEPVVQNPRLKRQLLTSLMQIKAIQEAAGTMVDLLRPLEGPN